jgi:hypothetical protein
MWNFNGKYNQILSSSPMPTFISEEHFWLMLARFFGLIPLPQACRTSFPTQDELKYITNYLISQPTPDDTCDESDDIRNLVKACIQLTRFIFRDPESRKILLGLEQGSGCSQNLSWELFQGFGAIEQFCSRAICWQDNDALSQYSSAWLHTNLASRGDRGEAEFPAQQCRFTFQVWNSLWILLLRARKEAMVINRTTRLGLRHIYTVLSTTDVNSPGQLGIEFSQFCPLSPRAERQQS